MLLKAPTQPSISHNSIGHKKKCCLATPWRLWQHELDANSTGTPRRQKDAGSPRLSCGPGSGNVRCPALTYVREKKRENNCTHLTIGLTSIQLKIQCMLCLNGGKFLPFTTISRGFFPRKFLHGVGAHRSIRGCAPEDSSLSSTIGTILLICFRFLRTRLAKSNISEARFSFLEVPEPFTFTTRARLLASEWKSLFLITPKIVFR